VALNRARLARARADADAAAAEAAARRASARAAAPAAWEQRGVEFECTRLADTAAQAHTRARAAAAAEAAAAAAAAQTQAQHARQFGSCSGAYGPVAAAAGGASAAGDCGRNFANDSSMLLSSAAAGFAPLLARAQAQAAAAPQWYPAEAADAAAAAARASGCARARPSYDAADWATYAPPPQITAATYSAAPAPAAPTREECGSFAHAATDTAVTYPVAVALPLKLGLALTNTPNGRGCYVKAVAPGSLAERVGVATGDKVVYLNNRLTRTLSEYGWAMDMARRDVEEGGGNVVAVQFARGERLRLVLYLPVA
jgi:hypothetical protein